MTTAPPPCDCCDANAWEYLFSESGLDLGRCAGCGLHYVAQMPTLEKRMTEMESGHFADGKVAGANAEKHCHGEFVRQRELQAYVDTVKRFAPGGKWLDIGCGTGTLLVLAHRSGREVDGIELTADRRALARQATGAAIYEQPIEVLDLAAESYAAVTLINVFSHLTSPSETLLHIRRVLAPRGIVVMRTGEIGPNVRKHHVFSWGLGDHLCFLGEQTIGAYAKKLAFEVVSRERVWFPETIYNREWFTLKGRSRIRNLVKRAVVHTPGALPLLRWCMLHTREARNPIFSSTLVLRKSQ